MVKSKNPTKFPFKIFIKNKFYLKKGNRNGKINRNKKNYPDKLQFVNVVVNA